MQVANALTLRHAWDIRTIASLANHDSPATGEGLRYVRCLSRNGLVEPMRSAGERLASRQMWTLLEPCSVCDSRADQGAKPESHE
jgi:hypothetical protein